MLSITAQEHESHQCQKTEASTYTTVLYDITHIRLLFSHLNNAKNYVQGIELSYSTNEHYNIWLFAAAKYKVTSGVLPNKLETVCVLIDLLILKLRLENLYYYHI